MVSKVESGLVERSLSQTKPKPLPVISWTATLVNEMLLRRAQAGSVSIGRCGGDMLSIINSIVVFRDGGSR